MNLAVIKTGGKQYLVKPNQKLRVEKLPGEVGATITFGEVLLVAEDDQVTIGQPFIEGAKVTAAVTGQGRGKKIIVQKYKPKVRYRKKMGHRQFFTEIIVKNIEY
ncbi:50S ribosomal protein L21 [Candidatus Uhrbacteria bacterium RIFCSPLOWO2_02_FULL_48_12]|uniref:Large ribosomal subunit protein bL21 n=1 Tax=Candidatus Uhrbacteria bacterium RIFCSPLOWO2_02_FULL_48_12 TaxID=1802407 RepID=A0A1F7VBC4_9BACT|nr:MAG: 50S ribosomal protein L21 [Candidatus Uhrbacteria bacterium RIFCSPLOWO2_02_FULL_48_12]